MEIEESSLYREIQTILQSPAKPVHHLWNADIHVAGQTYRALKVLSIDFQCDYEGSYADVVMLRLALPGGTYAKRIYPNQSNMDITLYKAPLQETGDAINSEAQPQSERYTATLLDAGNPMLEANGPNAPSEEALNLSNIFEIDFQLVNKALEQLRMLSVGGVYRKTTVEDVIKGVLTKESKRVVVEGVRMPQGVDMVPAANQEKRDHIIIPQGTRLTDVPQYIHKKCGGVYSTGMGYYLQGDYWYVYPCFDTKRFNQATRTLTIINVPKNKFPNIERTYRQDGKNTVVLATGDVRYRNDGDAQQLNDGNGIRFADAAKFMKGFATTVENVTKMARGANVTEFMSSARPNGNNNVQVSENAITANPFAEYSKMARREGSFLSLEWQNSLPSVIFPGMMVKVLYLLEEEIKTVYGVVLKCHHFVSLHGQGMTASRHHTTTALSLFVQQEPA